MKYFSSLSNGIGYAKPAIASLTSFSTFGNSFKVLMDSPEPWQLGFQDPATPIAQGIQDLHNDIFFFMVFVLVFVSVICKLFEILLP